MLGSKIVQLDLTGVLHNMLCDVCHLVSVLEKPLLSLIYFCCLLATECRITSRPNKFLDVFFEELLDLFNQATLPFGLREYRKVEIISRLVACVHRLGIEIITLRPILLWARNAVLLNLDRLPSWLVHPQ